MMPSPNSPRPPSLREVFLEALSRPTPAERAAYLGGACQGDGPLRAKVEALLRNHRDDNFLEGPAIILAAPDLAAPPTALAEGPGTHIGRYKLLEQTGEGGFGVVFMAEQEEPVRRHVALKVIKLGMDIRQVIARFEAERQSLALMDHPNIAKVLDAGATETGRPYFVMELVRGIRITDYCDQNHLSTRQRLDLFAQVCRAIQHAHQKGIIHRDIKPSNILVTLHDGVPVPKVIDFGIAKATEQKLTERTFFTSFAQFVGTPAYVSSEQAELSGLDIDTRSDIYSLGVLLYELLTGQTPFDAKQLLAAGLDGMRKIIRERQPVRPSTRLRQTRALPASPSPLSPLPSPFAPRHRSGLDRDEVPREGPHPPLRNGQWGVDRPPAAPQQRTGDGASASNLYRFQKLVRRHKGTVTAVAAVAVTLVLGVLVSTWQAVRANRLRALAQAEARHATEEGLRARRNAYDSDMLLAEQALAENNLGRASELLEKYTPKIAAKPTATAQLELGRSRPASLPSTDLRGWEWRYLSGQTRSDGLCTLGSHSNMVSGVAFSPDGQRLASIGWDGVVHLWDPVQRKPLAPTVRSENWEFAVAFSSDGRFLATVGDFEAVQLRDPATLQPLATLDSPNTNTLRILRLTFSPDSRLVAGSGLQGLHVWSVADRREIARFPAELALGEPVGLAFSPDGRLLASGHTANVVAVYRTDTFAPTQWLPREAKPECVRALAFSPDGAWLAGGTDDLSIWRVADGQRVTTVAYSSGARLSRTFLMKAAMLKPDGMDVNPPAGRDPGLQPCLETAGVSQDERSELSPATQKQGQDVPLQTIRFAVVGAEHSPTRRVGTDRRERRCSCTARRVVLA